MAETLLIGIGAQKSGTTWLADYLLNKQSDVYLPPVKEVHFFDNYCMPKYGQFFEEQRLAGLINQVQSLNLNNVGDAGINENLRGQLARFQAIKSSKTYLDFLNRGRTDQSILCDITPDYAILGADGFQVMKDTHPNVKLVFILRNPADRYWSSLRFNNTHNPDFDVNANFESMLRREDFVRFANYDRTIRVALGIFAPEQLHIEFYENLFTDQAMRNFCDWLGVTFVPGDYNTRANAAKTGAMTESQRRQAVLTYQQTYTEITARFPDTLPGSWREDMSKFL